EATLSAQPAPRAQLSCSTAAAPFLNAPPLHLGGRLRRTLESPSALLISGFDRVSSWRQSAAGKRTDRQDLHFRGYNCASGFGSCAWRDYVVRLTNLMRMIGHVASE